ncbi:MAG TPA: hypothetical protein VJ746_11250 [Nitrospira sp.]|nr:hypothetical protein [Nitrospira sp.]
MKLALRNSHVMALALVAGFAGPAAAGGQSTPGVGQGETSQQKSQQGIRTDSSSGVIAGGPEIIVGRIEEVRGDMLSLQGDRGQFMKLHVTKDSNIVCPGGEGAKTATSREGMKERSEIPISPATEQQMKHQDASRSQTERHALNDPNRQQREHQTAPPARDPSTLKDVVGSTDEAANQDIARGSGFVIGGSSGCQFKAGDRVRVEASDTGTITTLKSLSGEEERTGARIAGKEREQQ